jgi:hypothetical protein
MKRSAAATAGNYSWTPQRRSAVYCSPSCGGECQWSAFQSALKFAKELCKRLGPGWEPDVRENLGWYCAVRFPGEGAGRDTLLRMSVDASSAYRAKSLGVVIGYSIGLGSRWTRGKTPEAAVKAARAWLKEEQAKLVTLGDALKEFR